MAAHSVSPENHKSDVRSRVWTDLRKVAFPDSRFHFDFAEFISDFEGSSEANDRLVCLPCYTNASIVFITPDNCLENLRKRALQDGKRVLTTTYGIRRGFWLLDPRHIPAERLEYASTLDGMERVGRQVDLQDLINEQLTIPLMVTGTGAINTKGIRFGKGHGYYDLEWSMLYEIKAITTDTIAVSVVHDCQMLTEELHPEEFDTVCDFVVTPTRVIEVDGAQKPTCGILYSKLQPGMLDDIPPLRELQEIQNRAILA
jgi:5-formyltetrahydrofolate cyclo-ligase